MRPPINQDFSALVAEYERKHGAVQTTPIIIKDNPSERPANADRARDRANAKKVRK